MKAKAELAALVERLTVLQQIDPASFKALITVTDMVWSRQDSITKGEA